MTLYHDVDTQILNFVKQCPNHKHLIEFLKNNGENLKEIHLLYSCNVFNSGNDLLNLAIAKSCPNLKSLSTVFKYDEIETLKVILNSCQHLEGIKVWCGGYNCDVNELLEVIAKCSPKKFHEVEMTWFYSVVLFPEGLEPFFTSWANRIPQKSLSLIISRRKYSRLKKEV